MSLAMRHHESGLLVAEHGRDAVAIRRALKQLDDRLRLLAPEAVFPGTSHGYWRVVRVESEDRPAVPVATWMDAFGNPLPLSSGILEKVQRLRRDSRGAYESPDAKNDRLVAQIRKEREADREALHEEYEPYLERGRVGVTVGTRNKVPYYLRRYRGGDHPE